MVKRISFWGYNYTSINHLMIPSFHNFPKKFACMLTACVIIDASTSTQDIYLIPNRLYTTNIKLHIQICGISPKMQKISCEIRDILSDVFLLMISYVCHSDFSNNLEELPTWTWMVPELFIIYASHNRLRQLDCKFQNCLSNLPIRELHLHCNRIEFVSKDFIQRATR